MRLDDVQTLPMASRCHLYCVQVSSRYQCGGWDQGKLEGVESFGSGSGIGQVILIAAKMDIPSMSLLPPRSTALGAVSDSLFHDAKIDYV
jgi:hypothetical protein